MIRDFIDLLNEVKQAEELIEKIDKLAENFSSSPVRSREYAIWALLHDYKRRHVTEG